MLRCCPITCSCASMNMYFNSWQLSHNLNKQLLIVSSQVSKLSNGKLVNVTLNSARRLVSSILTSNAFLFSFTSHLPSFLKLPDDESYLQMQRPKQPYPRACRPSQPKTIPKVLLYRSPHKPALFQPCHPGPTK